MISFLIVKKCQKTMKIEHTKNIVSWYSHQQFVQYAAEHKYPRARRVRTPSPSHQRRVYMPPHEMIDRPIPGPPISADARTIPPIREEFSVTESHDFGQCVKRRLEKGEKAC